MLLATLATVLADCGYAHEPVVQDVLPDAGDIAADGAVQVVVQGVSSIFDGQVTDAQGEPIPGTWVEQSDLDGTTGTLAFVPDAALEPDTNLVLTWTELGEEHQTVFRVQDRAALALDEAPTLNASGLLIGDHTACDGFDWQLDVEVSGLPTEHDGLVVEVWRVDELGARLDDHPLDLAAVEAGSPEALWHVQHLSYDDGPGTWCFSASAVDETGVRTPLSAATCLVATETFYDDEELYDGSHGCSAIGATGSGVLVLAGLLGLTRRRSSRVAVV